MKLAARPGVRTLCEVGFNGGHTAVNLLLADPAAGSRLFAFDVGRHAAVKLGAAFAEENFPGRFELVLGDSRATLPEFARKRPDVRCDFIHIDGDKTYEGVRSDLANLRPLAASGAPGPPAGDPDAEAPDGGGGHTLIVNDVGCTRAWCEGGTRAWSEAKEAGQVVQAACYSGFEGARGWCVGRYAKKK